WLTSPRPPRSSLLPYTTLFRSFSCTSSRAVRVRSAGQDQRLALAAAAAERDRGATAAPTRQLECRVQGQSGAGCADRVADRDGRSEEHTSELQSREKLVCRLLL